MNIGDVSYSTKNRRAHDIAQNFDIETIQRTLTIAKKNVADCVESNENLERSLVPHSSESGFALFLENDFTKAQWERLVEDSKKRERTFIHRSTN